MGYQRLNSAEYRQATQEVFGDIEHIERLPFKDSGLEHNLIQHESNTDQSHKCENRALQRLETDGYFAGHQQVHGHDKTAKV